MPSKTSKKQMAAALTGHGIRGTLSTMLNEIG
jgi:hypothetical protein